MEERYNRELERRCPFVRFSTSKDGEIVGSLNRGAISDYVLPKDKWRDLYKVKIINLPIKTTYDSWVEQNEPFMILHAFVIKFNELIDIRALCIQAPFAGALKTYFCSEDDDILFKLYTPEVAKKLLPFYKVYNHPSDAPSVGYTFNIYNFKDFSEGLPQSSSDISVRLPCVVYDWQVDDKASVKKGQHVCTIIRAPYAISKREYKIYSPSSGILIKETLKTQFFCLDELTSCKFFTVYKSEKDIFSERYDCFKEEIEEDPFDNSVSLTWSSVANRELSNKDKDNNSSSISGGYTGFEMLSESGLSLFVSFQIQNNIPYIVFSCKAKDINLSIGDNIDLLVKSESGDSNTLSFAITNNIVRKKYENLYDISYFCELSEDDLKRLTEDFCERWRIRFVKYPMMSLKGINNNSWTSGKNALLVFRLYAQNFELQLEELKEIYPIEFSNPAQANSKKIENESCYVYLMKDISNGFYKIGISTNPEYRERTLQSEKPTIEKICAKEFPNRTIASAIESALHKSYESKRIRGEWFNLDEFDVMDLIKTLES